MRTPSRLCVWYRELRNFAPFRDPACQLFLNKYACVQKQAYAEGELTRSCSRDCLKATVREAAQAEGYIDCAMPVREYQTQ